MCREHHVRYELVESQSGSRSPAIHILSVLTIEVACSKQKEILAPIRPCGDKRLFILPKT